MRLDFIAAAAACAFMLATFPATAGAADAKSKKATSSKSSSAKARTRSIKGRNRPVSKKAVSARVKGAGKRSPVRVAAPVEAPEPEPPLSPLQLQLAQMVQTGVVNCEFDQSIQIEPHSRQPGAFQLKFRKVTYHMVPEQTTTGAVRLIDPRAGIVWLQIPVKSMLMDTRVGQRLVDACTSPVQRMEQALAAAAATTTSSAGASGLGIAAPTHAGAGTPLVPAADPASHGTQPPSSGAASIQAGAAASHVGPSSPAAQLSTTNGAAAAAAPGDASRTAAALPAPNGDPGSFGPADAALTVTPAD